MLTMPLAAAGVADTDPGRQDSWTVARAESHLVVGAHIAAGRTAVARIVAVRHTVEQRELRSHLAEGNMQIAEASEIGCAVDSPHEGGSRRCTTAAAAADCTDRKVQTLCDEALELGGEF